jgi:hypothetical protein
MRAEHRRAFGQTLASFFYLAHEHSTKLLRNFRIFHSAAKKKPPTPFRRNVGAKAVSALVFFRPLGTCQQLHSSMPKKVGPQHDNAVKLEVLHVLHLSAWPRCRKRTRHSHRKKDSGRPIIAGVLVGSAVCAIESKGVVYRRHSLNI